MKKTLVSALTTALVVGAASTTFAAANPFEDVPADHWAYDAIAQLAADGVIEGYGDGTYRGDQEITRYEMAQMIARAMAKGGGDKALIDKLAAEFADELNNLGVRVAALEKKVDNVKWGGRIRYRYINMHHEHGNTNPTHFDADGKADRWKNDDRVNVNEIRLRLEPQMKINEHWTGKARLDYYHSNNMDDAKNEDKVTVDRIYVQGDYKNFKILLGKLPYKTQADYGLIMDRYFSGGSITFGSDVKVALNMGRMNNSDNSLYTEYVWKANNPSTGRDSLYGDGTTNYGSIEIYGDRAKKFTWGLGWHYFKYGKLDQFDNGANGDFDSKNYSIFALGLGYKFTPDVELTGAWSRAIGIDLDDASKRAGFNLASAAKNSYAFQLNYKGAKPSKVNSWGAYVAWRQIGMMSSTGWQTYALNGPQYTGSRGFEIGASWAPMKNVVGKLAWFTGKDVRGVSRDVPGIEEDHKVNTIFTEWSFIF